MPLSPGTKIGSFEILSPLGAGGMGEVYRARDTRLEREVAIKVLAASFANEADRLRRFEQEARATSALNHPNILAIFDIGSHEGAPYIVAELLEGEVLRDRLNRGPLSGRKAIEYALQIAAGLAAAHEKGIVHRDLKPENLFITNDERVKILDFGLAKLKPGKLVGGPDSEAATIQAQTDPGVVMGTVGYMSPEQVRGQEADHRGDIFSFGAILYEMVTGRRAFGDGSIGERMSSILKDDPPDIARTNIKVPPQLERVIQRCLEKKPERRFQSASDLGFAIEAISSPSGSTVATPGLETGGATGVRAGREKLWMSAAILLGLALLASLLFTLARLRQTPADASMVRLYLPPPDKVNIGQITVSPDGRWIAFSAATGGKDQLWVRPLDALNAQVLPGTEGASFPFWSPDSRFLAFFASGKLKKIDLARGAVQTLVDTGIGFGGTWNREGIIVFGGAVFGSGLSRVSATGGSVSPVATADKIRRESFYLFPSFLPDGRHFVVYVRSARKDICGIYVGSLDQPMMQLLAGEQSNALYSPSPSGDGRSGYLLFMRESMIYAQPFDCAQLRTTGELFPVGERIGSYPNYPFGSFSVSDNGVLLYDGNLDRMKKRLIWMDRAGKQIGAGAVDGSYSKPWLSPDEKRVLVDRPDLQTGNRDLWLQDLVGGGASRFTFDPADDWFPLWSHDGERIAWSSNRGERYELYHKGASGAGQDELLLKSSYTTIPTDWSQDDQFIIYYEINPKTKRDIWVLPTSGDRKPFPFLRTEANEVGGQLSPDAKWMAYASDESGAYEVYVQAFPAGGGKKQVSTKGGTGPHWRKDGKELFFYSSYGKLIASEVRSDTTFEMGIPHELFEFRSGNGVLFTAPYTVSADGNRFLLNTLVDESGGAPLTVVLNWTSMLKK